jgi:hypothetical protein
MKIAFMMLSVFAVASGYYLVVTSPRFVLHFIVLISFVVRAIGSFFKILHWTGADELLMISYIGFGLGGFLLIWTGLRNPTRKLLHYQLITGVLIGLIVIDTFVPVDKLADLVRLVPYPLAALSGTILLREVYVHQGEKNMVAMYFIIAIIAVINDVSHLL